jgi:hypothetical protein
MGIPRRYKDKREVKSGAGHGRNFLSHGWEIRGETSRSMKDTRRSERDRVRSGTGTERSGMEDPRGVLGDLRET